MGCTSGFPEVTETSVHLFKMKMNFCCGSLLLLIIAIRYQYFTFKLALRLYCKMSAPIDDFKTFHWLSHVTCFHCQTEAFTAVFLQVWNYRSVRVTTDFYIRVLKFEKDPDVTSHKPNQSYTEHIVAVLIPNRKAGFAVRFMRTHLLEAHFEKEWYQ